MRSSKLEMDGSERIRFKCDICDSSFLHRSNLSRHRKTIHKKQRCFEKKYACDICKTAFANISNLRRHERNSHNKEVYQCDACKVIFTTKHEFVSHWHKTHKCHKVLDHQKQLYEMCVHCHIEVRNLEAHYNTCKRATKSIQSTNMEMKGEERRRFKCDLCDCSFLHRSNLSRHRKIIHKTQRYTEKKYTCEICKSAFSSIFNLKRHEKNSHNKTEIYRCDACEVVFTLKRKLISHWRKFHEELYHEKKLYEICSQCHRKVRNLEVHLKTCKYDPELNVGTLIFPSEEAFHTWKKKIEIESVCKFVLRNGKTKYREVYQCHRSGYYRTKSAGQRCLKKQGSIKIGGQCPASIQVNKMNGEFHVMFKSTHRGHDKEIYHINLSSSEKTEIATKLADRIPSSAIIDDARSSYTGAELKRIHLLNNQDISNISREFNLPKPCRKYRKEVVSVDLKVRELMDSEKSCILFYKPQDVVNESYAFLNEEDFVLIIMNSAQVSLLQVYGKDVITVDGISDIGCDFQLHTLFVLDELRQPFPCGFLISNRKDTPIFTFFYETVKKATDIIKPAIFMSNMVDELYDAWVAVMGEVPNRLYCTWHVDLAWEKNLNKIKNLQKRKNVYKNLLAVLQEWEENKFISSLQENITFMEKDEDLNDFCSYFKNYYSPTTARWACCYRKHMGLRSNMNLERLHKTISYIFSNGKYVGRLNEAIDCLLKISQDRLFDRLVTHKGEISSKLRNLRVKHKTSTDLQVTESDDTFIVTSLNNVFYVNQNITNCDCKLICTTCESCIHNYVCTCVESFIKWNMCKHIHHVCQNVKNKNRAQTPIEVIMYLDDSSTEYTEIEIPIDLNEETEFTLPELQKTESCPTDEDLLSFSSHIISSIKTDEDRNRFLKLLKEFENSIHN